MPLYEYECQQCHKHTEKRQKFSDPEITDCPHCGGKLQRVLSAPAFAFAGGGWYKDLYSSAKPGANKSPEGASSNSTGDSPKGSDSKGGDSKGGDSKGGDSKSSENKSSGDSKPTSSDKPASAPAPSAPASSSSSSSDKK